MNKFKIGDKIRMLEACNGNEKGEEYIVEEKNEGDMSILSAGKCNCQEKWELVNKTLKDVKYGDIITNGNWYIYIFGRVDEVIFAGGSENSIEEASKSFTSLYTLPRFLESYKNYHIYNDEEITIEEAEKLTSKKIKR